MTGLWCRMGVRILCERAFLSLMCKELSLSKSLI